jgi:pyruvate dehydrogenase E1 component alpha subunit/2-oxoisovalerate dehydrogenase E1 component
MYDPELYRDKAEVEEWKKRDPIPALIARIQQEGPRIDAEVIGMERDIATEVEEAIAFAEAGTWEPVQDLLRFVYSEKRA